jgi:hypothetical protein
MPVDLPRLIDSIEPRNTVLLFGSGSSVPSGAPNVAGIVSALEHKHGVQTNGYTLRELASLVEQQASRPALIKDLRGLFDGVKPTRGLLNIPLYDWKSLYTTNYDDLIEQCYARTARALTVYSSDFDFTIHTAPEATKLFKLHGTIEKDIADGHRSRIIITESDYDNTANYREGLYDRFKGDLAGSHLVIIGQSLLDPDIRELANRAAELSNKLNNASRISLMLYEQDANRAQLFEKRGFTVCFGGIDEFFSELARKLPKFEKPQSESEAPLDAVPALRAITVDVAHASDAPANVSGMFNGWPASHADIVAGLTFERSIAEDIDPYLRLAESLTAVVVGASGVGKTTAARQTLQRLRRHGLHTWEHQGDYPLKGTDWARIAVSLAERGELGVLFIDEAHSHLPEINGLVDLMVEKKVFSLKLLCASTRNHWNPRIKTPYLFKFGREFKLGRLKHEEIDRLLRLVDTNPALQVLVESTFTGFSVYEKRRRLVDRCESEMFVCLKNIFASEAFDDIILREYATLAPLHQDIYRHVAAMESAGVRVHRQLVIRLLGIPAVEIAAALVHLTDIVNEYAINEREGLYGWKGRHTVIAEIISRYKYPDIEKRVELFSKVIANISPTYDLEVRTVRELCNLESGLPSIPDKSVQNVLLRNMMSVVPGERVPRHRLIRNLIEMGDFEKADTEIRIFEKDFGRDGPVARYKIALLTARATKTPGIMEEDRLAILERARALAVSSIERFPYSKTILSAYCEVGFEVYRRTKEYAVYDHAMAELRSAEDRIGDPEISKLIARYQRRIAGQMIRSVENGEAERSVDDELAARTEG